jgi:5S rRNA maturation endonuclease (ribonuclease M5)
MNLMDTEDVQKAWASVAKKLGYQVAPCSRGKITHRHDYMDEHGSPVYVVNRHEDGSASYRRYTNYPFTAAGLGKKKRLLYNLPEVIAADVIVIVEGEKKADILSERFITDTNEKKVAITTTGGAESWRLEFTQHLRSKRVLILPDSDEPGQRYRDAIIGSLTKVGIEHQVVSFEEYGNDVRDFLEQNETAELIEYIDSAWLSAPAVQIAQDFSEISI